MLCNFSLLNLSLCKVWWCSPVIPEIWDMEIGGSQSEANLGKSRRPYLKKQTKTAKGLGQAQVVEHLSSKQEALK
jgi:hypothetical protein